MAMIDGLVGLWEIIKTFGVVKSSLHSSLLSLPFHAQNCDWLEPRLNYVQPSCRQESREQIT